ncbi:MAG: alpha/beta fold hydrolase [Rhodoferax sp.]|nr:alpha/beta fold hydrolase [Rhodoferax sp.]
MVKPTSAKDNSQSVNAPTQRELPSTAPGRAEPVGARASAPLLVREIGSMHVGGRSATLDGLPGMDVTFSPGNPPFRVNPNGAFEIEQMYVQYVRLVAPRAFQPLLLMHGGGLCGVCYETTPDGRPGWQSFFLHAGHDVHVADAVERGRASWARSPEFLRGAPMFRTKAEAWELFRIGPEGSWRGNTGASQPYPDSRFPVDAFDQSMKQSIPRWTTTDAAIQAAYDTLAHDHGPFAIIAHSQGGNFAFNMALRHPGKVRAIVALEPSGFPDPVSSKLHTLAGIPHLFIWGDNTGVNETWLSMRRGLARYIAALRASGVAVDEFDLPSMGIRGNSHMLMMDRNSDEIAARVQRWFESRDLMG